MAKFKVRSIDAGGQMHVEIMDAADITAVYGAYKDKGVTLISAEAAGAQKMKLSIEIPLFRKIKLRDKIIFTRNLGAMIEAGLSMSRALTVIEKQTKHKRFKNIVNALNKSIS